MAQPKPSDIPQDATLSYYLFLGVHNDRGTRLYQFAEIPAVTGINGKIPNDFETYLAQLKPTLLNRHMLKGVNAGGIISVYTKGDTFFLKTACFELYLRDLKVLEFLQMQSLIAEHEILSTKETRRNIELDALEEHVKPFREFYQSTDRKYKALFLAILIQKVTSDGKF